MDRETNKTQASFSAKKSDEVSKKSLSGKKKIFVIIGVFACLVLALYLFLAVFFDKSVDISRIIPQGVKNAVFPQPKLFEKSKTEADFYDYLKKSEQQVLSTGSFGSGGIVSIEQKSVAPTLQEGALLNTVSDVRYSETNIQVSGVDEPDIVKTDGKNIYFSPELVFARPLTVSTIPSDQTIDEKLPVSDYPKTGTSILLGFTPDELSKLSAIDKSGNLLVYNNTLVIWSQNNLYGYDISHPESPKEVWKIEYDEGQGLTAMRLIGGKLYVVSRTNVSSGSQCPIPLTGGTTKYLIPCTDIYHPRQYVPTDATFTLSKIDATEGKVENRVSFLGSSGFSVVYVSGASAYITDTYYKDIIGYLYNFYVTSGRDLVSKEVLKKIENLKDIDISTQAKLTEFGVLVDGYYSSLSASDRLKIQNDFANRMNDYSKAHIRDLEKTQIAKISLNKMEVVAAGEVSGHPLNQFSLDEYNNNLRVGVTSGDGISDASVSDVVVLGQNLESLGSVEGLGKGERIYSTRFIEDRGYVVTFKQTDPLYVLDLSNPKKPELAGQIEIPGYSSYLHPLDKGLLLGVGKEGQKVKVSLFDVSDDKNPREISKYVLDEYWTDIANSHHAFLQDKAHQLFFIPGSKGGYVFTYTGSKLDLTKAISLANAKRSLYIDTYLYLMSDTKIVVYDEDTWSEVASLDI